MTRAKKADRDFSGVVAIAVDDESGARDAIIGKISWYTISNDLRVTPDELTAIFETFDIPEDYTPAPINPARQLTSLLRSTKVKRAQIGKHGYDLAFEVEEKEDGSIAGFLVRKRRAERRSDGADWDLRTVADVVWSPEIPDAINTAVRPAFADDGYPYDLLLADLEREFEDRCTWYTGSVVGEVVSKILNDMMGVLAKPNGGVWLIDQSGFDLLERTQKMIELLDAEYRRQPKDERDRVRPCSFDVVPLIDGTESRVIVRGIVERKVLADLDDAIDKLYALVDRGEKPRTGEIVDAEQRRADALAIRERWAEIASIDLGSLDERLRLFDRVWEATSALGTERAS